MGALRGILRNEQLVLLVLAVIMGVVASYGAIAFRYLYLMIQGISFGTFADTLYTQAQNLPAWQILLVPTVGGLLIGLFVHFFLPGQRPHAVADVMEAVAVRSGRIGTGQRRLDRGRRVGRPRGPRGASRCGAVLVYFAPSRVEPVADH